LSLSDERTDLAERSRASAKSTWRRLGAKLVVVELAIAVILLVSAGLLGKSLYLLLRVQLGLHPENLATLQVSLPQSSYPKDPQVLALVRNLENQVAQLPGVQSVGLSSDLPVNGWGDTTWFRVIGRPWHGEHYEVAERDVSPEYFEALGSKLVRGRYFREEEDAAKPLVAIINQTMAREYFPGQDPLGQQVTRISQEIAPMEIVGIVEDIKEGQPDSTNRSALYLPFNQTPGRFFNLVVRTSQDEHSIFPALDSTIRKIDRGILATNPATMTEIIHDSPSAYIHRSAAWLIGGFAAVALLLGVVGLYGVVAYSVSQRTREIGVRMAVGAQRSTVYRLVLKESGFLILLGLTSGLILATFAASFMKAVLFNVHAWDPVTLLCVLAVLTIATFAASLVPAHRAASVDPVDALRSE
jgi:macrolide transport system ATP-binding/permease protein